MIKDKEAAEEAGAMLEFVNMAREDKDSGRVMSSDLFKEKIAKAKLKAELKK